MTTPDQSRPTPESFLDAARAEEASSRPGRLKIFLGASPGVGKTYAMLEEARLRARSGLDVVVALVETHGRVETAALLAPLEQIPRRVIEYRGQMLEEMDLDALLVRKPRLAIIDEFAHTNASGSRHPKRWQDVLEVLDAGIDVVTTLNIQHIESLNDVVAQITGVRVHETVPDAVLDRADQIELIDLPPEELIQRLKDGKVYLPQQAGRALENFFTKAKLTALREIALRTAAGRVDAEMLDIKKAQADRTIWPTADRLLVCVNEAPVAKALVRAGKRMAERAKIPWIVVSVLTPKHEAMEAETRSATQDALRLAETLGAETVTLRAESDAAREILRFARERNVTRLVIGRSRWHNSFVQRLVGLIREPVSETLLDEATDFEITVVTAHARAQRRRALARGPAPHPATWLPGFWRAALEASLAVLAATLLAWPFWFWLPVASIAVIYLVAVLIVAFRRGLPGALLGSVFGFLAYNFFFTTPYFSFAVEQYEAVVGLAVFVVSSVVTGTLASRLRAQVVTMRATQARTETLYEFARKIASATKSDDVLWAAVAHVARVLQADVLILTPDAQGQLQQVQGWPSIDEALDPRDLGAAQWAFEKAEAAGFGTGTLPNATWQFVPLATADRPFGTMGVHFHDPSRAKDPETKRLLLAVEDQVAIAVERNRLSEEVANARVTAESDKLRAALLNAVSHDLRTPLVTVIGATSSLAESGASLPENIRAALATSAHEEARRLDRTVQNLLDMTRLGHGALKPNRAAIDLREIIGRVRADLGRVLTSHALNIEIAPGLPPLDVDPILIGQALANVLENAAKYAPAGSSISLAARRVGGNAEILVSDSGPGICVADRAKVFDLFYRAAQGDGTPAGTGMGLAIVKGLVEAHGGQVTAEAGPGGDGTTIRLVLPVASLSPEGPAA
ncbi:MAG: sensor histidine kinase KdpD [Proteobacteria bacterium]|nr:sensor histidine kinase KdpD [Pseudomonadota bacterium]